MRPDETDEYTIKKITIENYKSVENLTLELGRVNVFIGENGCGKSNILEAIALCSASTTNKLDNEFLTSRGIRVTQNPKLMRSAFDIQNVDKEIKISVEYKNGKETECKLQNDNSSPYSKWTDLTDPKAIILKETFGAMERKYSLVLGKTKNSAKLTNEPDPISAMITKMVSDFHEKTKNWEIGALREVFTNKLSSMRNFIIYSPENTLLRTFEKEGQILPLGIKGEGLFKLLKVISQTKKSKVLQEIKEQLELISWFKDFYLPDNLSENEKYMRIQDRYIHEKLEYFDQVSTNEGFLFLLFYFCLFISKETPRFFAIDNIDASLNPKLCTELIMRLAQLAKKHQKQVIFTTHNPAILDGLNLNDDDQRLFIIYRNQFGHTKTERYLKPKTPKDGKSVRLSEAFLRGYLGGLPENF